MALAMYQMSHQSRCGKSSPEPRHHGPTWRLTKVWSSLHTHNPCDKSISLPPWVGGDDSIMKMGGLLRRNKSVEKQQRYLSTIHWQISQSTVILHMTGDELWLIITDDISLLVMFLADVLLLLTFFYWWRFGRWRFVRWHFVGVLFVNCTKLITLIISVRDHGGGRRK
jgi:hypothetical protein